MPSVVQYRQRVRGEPMKHEQHTQHSQVRASDATYVNAWPATLPDFQHAFAWHTDLCGLSEKVLQEYVEEMRQAAKQCHDPQKTRCA